MKTKTLILAALSAVVLAGCGGTIPGVPQEFRDFFPYQTGDTIVFTNGLREEKLCVTYVHVDEYRDYCGYADTKAFLPIEMSFSTDATSLFSLNGYMWSDFNVSSFDVRFEMAMSESACGGLFEGTLSKTDTLLVMGNAENVDSCIKSVLLEKGKGITAFYDANHDEEWVLKEIK